MWQTNTTEQLTNAARSPEFQFGRQSARELWKGALRRTAPKAALVSLQPSRLSEVLANVTEVAA